MTRLRYADRDKWLEQKRRANAKNEEYRRDWHLRKRYGISLECYERLLESQKGACAICQEPPTRVRLAVDHNHETGAVRGLLCFACNTSLGHLERTDWRVKAEAYLAARPSQE